MQKFDNFRHNQIIYDEDKLHVKHINMSTQHGGEKCPPALVSLEATRQQGHPFSSYCRACGALCCVMVWCVVLCCVDGVSWCVTQHIIPNKTQVLGYTTNNSKHNTTQHNTTQHNTKQHVTTHRPPLPISPPLSSYLTMRGCLGYGGDVGTPRVVMRGSNEKRRFRGTPKWRCFGPIDARTSTKHCPAGFRQ